MHEKFNFGYFSDAMLELAYDECQHVNHNGRVKGLKLVMNEEQNTSNFIGFGIVLICH